MRVFVLGVLLGVAWAQEAPPNGPRRVDPMWHAITGATVHVAPGRTLENAIVVWKGDRIVSVGADAPPAGARAWDGKGLHVYAGLIDAYVPVDVPAGEPRHWNPLITPWRLAREVDDPTAKELRELGFTAAAVAPRGGILRGQASLVSLAPREADLSVPRPTVYVESVWQVAGFDTVERPPEGRRRPREGYPTSQMGAIALLRQSLLDGVLSDLPNVDETAVLLFDTEDELEALRAKKVADTYGAGILGCGTEFRRLDAIAGTGLPVILPLRFPEPPDVSSVGAADAADLRDMMTWEQAPTNPRRLDDAKVRVALTTAKLPKRDKFPRRLAEAMRHGLTEERALAMLTTTPALLLGVANEMGTVEPKKLANLVVTEGPLFVREPVVREVWIEGRRHEVTPPLPPCAGTWQVEGLPLPGPLLLTISRKKRGEFEATLKSGDEKLETRHVTVVAERLGFAVASDALRFTLSAVARQEGLLGEGIGPDGARFPWRATRAEPPAPPAAPAPEPADAPGTFGLPFGPYALEKPPQAPDLVIVRGATIWTCGPKGVIENGELQVRRGKITYVGPVRGAPGDAAAIDARGLHVTPGIVDCHSHTGISKGVNEAGQAVTAEVRIGDVTDPDSISWYRQLAGGVTTVNSLHGSANPIGGQNQVNKVRWGVPHPDDMHFEGAPPGIKFALGENVKQSNWGDDFTTRYPQTRMGVETLMRDRFLAAREYAARHDRKDLELEALAEVLRGERLVHCHSYRQDEILMLCRLAEEFGFRIGTFQHVLEGYKVADAIRDRSLGGSAFSDWWAYKVEVQDAIPWNGALMHEVGVCVSFNSDSDEMARRLNLEAAKAMKYGELPAAEALKFVTLNPAKQLKIDAHVGSLEEGKDADFAMWSGPPLSVYSRCVATWVDGREYFSVGQDEKHRERIAKERQRLIQKILGRKRDKDDEKEKGEGRGEPARSAMWRCGECGCREEGR
jgi:imidazolonepropionase-like amidohydrolase